MVLALAIPLSFPFEASPHSLARLQPVRTSTFLHPQNTLLTQLGGELAFYTRLENNTGMHLNMPRYERLVEIETDGIHWMQWLSSFNGVRLDAPWVGLGRIASPVDGSSNPYQWILQIHSLFYSLVQVTYNTLVRPVTMPPYQWFRPSSPQGSP